MASKLQSLSCSFFILSSYMLSGIGSVHSAECPEYYALFEETSCDSANATKIKPSLINHSTWNVSKYDTLTFNTSSYEFSLEDCYTELVCDHVETVCEEPVLHTTTEVQHVASTTESVDEENYTELSQPSTPEYDLEFESKYVESTTNSEVMGTTITNAEDEVEPECKQFFNYIVVKTCEGGNSTIINPIAVELNTYFKSNMSLSMLSDDPSCPFVPLEYQFAQLMCEEVLTECEQTSRTTQPHVGNSTENYALIVTGSVGAAAVVSALTYFGAMKVLEALQSGTYHLPN